MISSCPYIVGDIIVLDIDSPQEIIQDISNKLRDDIIFCSHTQFDIMIWCKPETITEEIVSMLNNHLTWQKLIR